MIQSPLHGRHLDHGAKMAPFAGWEMPIQYQGIVSEHRAVREGCGLFDISHMGEFFVEGSGAEAALDRLLTNRVSDLEPGRGQYTLMLNEKGGVIDDLILYRLDHKRFFLVVNAARIDEDRSWLEARLPEDVSFFDRSADFGAVAVQGPSVAKVWESVERRPALPDRNGIVVEEGGDLVLCRTGYTGEDGFELFARPGRIGKWFDELIENGATPCGLGARDTLRLEKGYPLNGSDLDVDHTPLEAGLGFFVALDKPGGFVGSEALAKQKADGPPTRLAAIRMTGKAPPPRPGYEVRDAAGERVLGTLTSGSLSPSLDYGIGMAYLDREMARPGNELTVVIRERAFPAITGKKPFFPES